MTCLQDNVLPLLVPFSDVSQPAARINDTGHDTDNSTPETKTPRLG